MISAARTGLAAAAALAVAAAAYGWLYLLRGAPVPGPRIQALPLDELAHRSAVPLVLFLAVWLAVGLIAGLVARAAGAGRLTAAFLLALSVGGWAYLATGVSLLVVRQIPAAEAFAIAAGLRPVLLPAALAAVGGALTGRAQAPGSRPRAPFVLSWLVAAAAALGLVDALLPHEWDTLVDSLAPARLPAVTHALVVPISLALMVAARGLARRRRRAWQVSVALLALSTALHVLHGFGRGALATALLAAALVARRHCFDAPGDPEAAPRAARRALAGAALLAAYGVVALWINRMTADQPFSVAFALHETAHALFAGSSQHLGGRFGRWFPLSVLLGAVGGCALLLREWTRPWRYRLRQEALERERVRALMEEWGADTLAPFVLRADKSYFFGSDPRAFVAYRVVAGVAVVSGDPIGPPDALERVVEEFIAFARGRDWRIAVLGASERCLPVYRSRGLHALYHGDEAVLDVDRFSLEGRAIRKVRQSTHRLEKAGYRCVHLHPCELGEELRAELEAIALAWRGDAPERGYAMALDALFRLEDEDAVFAIGLDGEGRPRGFLHFAVAPASRSLTLSSMPRRRDTPNGFNEWLVCETAVWARERGYRRISLNFAPFAALLAPEARLSPLQRVQRCALLALKGRFQLDNLLLFNRKFLPSWERRFVVYERLLDLPRVGLAALAAEAYLPGTGRR